MGAAVAIGLVACGGPPSAPTLFQLLPPDSTGVAFVNRLTDDTAFNILNYLYYYDGGGVAVGDVNNDGRVDLYFTSNTGSNRLYLNKGNYRFEDVTARAGVADSIGWKTGVTMADINGDGWVDIYVSGVDYLTTHGRNVLYINNGDGTFTDRSHEYGLDYAGQSTQALFFDYDGDGDLDMYLVTHSPKISWLAQPAPGSAALERVGGDRLYRNDHNHFTDVTAQAGLTRTIGYGLGVVASDFNGDGCPDLYVANDFEANDLLYLNNCDGTFTESIGRATGHTSRSSMGVDAADVNNDGRPDVMVLDMLPDREAILKTSANADPYAVYDMRVRAGYHPQDVRNTLQLNRGTGRFSEIADLAGVAATDWSWTPLFADLDNDGRKDLFITNGIDHRPNDLDYIAIVGSQANQASLAHGPTRETLTRLLQRMPHVPIAKYAFRNNGDLTFINQAAAWGLDQPGFSNGAVYADLNNSGALDLVVNNLNAPASIYRNRAQEQDSNNYLRVDLHGVPPNTAGIGAKVFVTAGGQTQIVEQMPTRGFESSVDPRPHFGLGHAEYIDSVVVIWPDSRMQVLRNIRVGSNHRGDSVVMIWDHHARKLGNVVPGRTLTFSEKDASPPAKLAHGAKGPGWLTDVTDQLGITVRHRENVNSDFNREPLLPHLLSTEGPALATGDVNGDGLDDIYLGGAKWQPGQLLLQQRDGRFRLVPQPAIAADSLAEDVAAGFFDANGDGRPDLYVVSGGNEFWGTDDALQDRLYLNDGHGTFHRDTTALPRFEESGSCVVPGDFNGDGKIDLFVGRRVIARRYGAAPRSYLLQNDGSGHFRDVTADLAPGLAHVGMVTSAAWVDYDGDGKLDLIVVGEWMAVRVFHQEQGHLVDRTAEAGLAGTEGWWNSVTAVDLSGDGHPDLLLGNLGLNTSLRASPTEPARMYVGDFAHSGGLEQVITSYRNGTSYPIANRDEMIRAIPPLARRFPTYSSFAAQSVADLLGAADVKQAQLLEAHTFASAVALNNGHGGFTLRPLPALAQIAPVYAGLAADFDGDGHTDLLLGGNLYGMAPVVGRSDASYGLVLRGTGDGTFTAVDLTASRLVIEGQVRHMQLLRLAGGGHGIAVARNNDRLELWRLRR
jgi:hypothetical protein